MRGSVHTPQVNSRKTYHVAQLLVQAVTGPTTSLLEGYLHRNPVAQMSLIFFREVCPSEEVQFSVFPIEAIMSPHSSPARRPPGFL